METVTSCIPEEVADLLVESRYGISFPCDTGCQMRFIENGEDHGGFYAYSHWGNKRKAVLAAISRNLQLRSLFNRNKTGRPRVRNYAVTRSNTGVLGVSKNSYYDKRRDRTYVRYMASWRKEESQKSRGFHLLSSATADQHLHALRTAIAFRQEWKRKGDQFDPARYALWKQKRLYQTGTPELPHNFWD